MTSGSDDGTTQLLDRFLEAMDTLTDGLDKVYTSDDDRRLIHKTQDLVQRLEKQIRGDGAVDELVHLVEALTDNLQLSPSMWLNSLSGSSDRQTTQELHEEARVAFYTLRAHLFPDGKVWASRGGASIAP